MEAGQGTPVEVIAGDPLEDIGRTGENGKLVGHGVGKWLVPLAVDEDRGQHVARTKRPLDDDVALGDEVRGHVATRLFALLTKDMVSKSDEDLDARVVGIGDLESHGCPGFTVRPRVGDQLRCRP